MSLFRGLIYLLVGIVFLGQGAWGLISGRLTMHSRAYADYALLGAQARWLGGGFVLLGLFFVYRGVKICGKGIRG